MKSFSRFLLEKDNKTSSIKGSSDSYTQPNLFDTSKTGKEDPVKGVRTTKDITGDRRRRGRPIGSKNKVVNQNAPIQSSLDTSKSKVNNVVSDSDKVGQGLGKSDPSKNLKGQSSDIKTKRENTVKNKTNTNKIKVSKKISGDGKIVFKPKPGEKTASNLIVKQQTPGTNVSIKPSKTYVTKNTSTVTTNVTNTKNPIDYKGVSSGGKVKTTKPQVTTNVTNPKRFKNFLDRVLVSTGVKTDPKYKSKFTTPSSNVTVSGSQSGTNKVLKDVSKKALRSKIFKGLGRFAGGAFAAKDAYDAARDEKLLGRSRTSQVLAGLSKGLGGYLGGALGATLGTIGGGGIGSFALGTGGAITGYNLGSKLGDYIYNQGRKLATGETKIRLPGKKTFKKFKDDITNKVKNIRK